MNTILRKETTPDKTKTPSEAASILGLGGAFSGAKQPFYSENRDFTQLSDLNMEKSCSMRRLISEGFSAIPRAVLNNLTNPDEQERLIANILFIFFRDARFKDGTMALTNAVYPCRRGQLVVQQKKMAAQMMVNYRSFQRVINVLKSDGIIEVERLKDGSRITITAYDMLVGAKLKEHKPAEPKKLPCDVYEINMREMFPDQNSN
ncbi:MAG: hypothetical protein ACK5HZ_00475 [Macellibacteroides fermentans]|uniref:hypothetical protein n=1 Tax=Macellibacteroides fermentans TaxID=879969 RepID=UPI003ACC3A2A